MFAFFSDKLSRHHLLLGKLQEPFVHRRNVFRHRLPMTLYIGLSFFQRLIEELRDFQIHRRMEIRKILLVHRFQALRLNL